jgi:hypothetical protein
MALSAGVGASGLPAGWIHSACSPSGRSGIVIADTWTPDGIERIYLRLVHIFSQSYSKCVAIDDQTNAAEPMTMLDAKIADGF